MIFFIGAVFTLLAGILILYLCRRFGTNRCFAALLPINCSIWESFKPLFWPMVIFSAAEYFNYGMYFDNFIAAKAISILCAILWMAALTYIFTSIWGKLSFYAQLGIFAVSCAVGYAANYIVVKNYFLCTSLDKIFGLALIVIFMICFAVFSFMPPKYGMFKDREL